ncbi:tripartite tricarboxylate transporter permease [Acuticoccus mangrovi]|uniref:Tripartite tricarboxylate transporter permease n=1 Tax=Acuticoccus mangrovi TaxID=2796142 RepID=A0A934MHV6_9HYPH|nr:tripartite tricarboxylate transporter permease [Acuticoccus mangrovi]MBJ3778093.1 tripartite tricarboxylate transporter permease [Acuticoccus mangrovi]
MDTLAYLAQGFSVAMSPTNLALALFGCVAGTMIGSLPGLGPVNGVAILIPLAFSLRLDPTSALILLSAVYYGAMYGGRISSVILNIPGDEPAIMTTLDGYPMALKGKAAEALAVSGVASFIGSTVATLGLTLFAPLLAQAAIYFGPADYFALYVLAFATIGGVSGMNPLKTLLAACIGLMLATVGLDPGTGTARYTGGMFELYDGFDPIVAIVGLFAISEMLMLMETRMGEVTIPKVGRVVPRMKDILFSLGAMIRGSCVGFIAGILPGAGASLGAVMSYSVEKRVSDKNKTFGTGDPRGVAAPEAGNNAASGAALIPMLTLGVPGSGTTAVMLAMLISFNVQPGPLLFDNQPEIVWGLIASLYIANVVLLILNIPMIGLFTRILMLPQWALMPFVLMVSFLGIFAISNSTFGLLVMIAFGVLGYILRKMEFSLIPVVLGVLLGGDMEDNLRRALSISGGDPMILVQSWISVALFALTAILLVVAFVFSDRSHRKAPDIME